MAGKEDGPSKANGVAKPDDKGKGKVEDLKDHKNGEEKTDKTKGGDKKLLPPGRRA